MAGGQRATSRSRKPMLVQCVYLRRNKDENALAIFIVPQTEVEFKGIEKTRKAEWIRASLNSGRPAKPGENYVDGFRSGSIK
jgi:hypothetical protein